MKSRIRAGIVGAAGYTGGELLRLLLRHEQVEITFAHSNSHAGEPVTHVHDDLLGDTELVFTNESEYRCNVIFLCLPHGQTRTFLKENPLDPETRIVDLSNEFRATGRNIFEDREFIYGLPELNRDQIRSAKNIANPGCFATAIQLALLPLASIGAVNQEVFVSAVTGSTGAGQNLSATTHYSWRHSNHSVYNAFTHQHLTEIDNSMRQLDPGFNAAVHFIPQRGAFSRGIYASVEIKSNMTAAQAAGVYQTYYKEHPFTFVSAKPVHLKQTVNTNKCLLSFEQYNGQLLISSVIDNLLKGASGQAVQNMNLMFGLPETMGLLLKPSAF